MTRLLTKFIFIFLLFTILFSCLKVNEIDPDTSPIILEEGEKELSVTVELPPNSNIQLKDIQVSSFASDATDLTSLGEANIPIYESDGFELLFATDENEDILLLSYVIPNETDSKVIDHSTTALALVMMHPWTFDLTTQNKKDTIEYIKQLEEFQQLEITIKENIAKGQLDYISTQDVLDKLVAVYDKVAQKQPQKLDPFQVNVDVNKVTIKNKSVVHYGVGLFDKNGKRTDSKRLPPNGTITFNLTENRWKLNGENGIIFIDSSDESTAALKANTFDLFINLVSLFSSDKAAKFKKDNCYSQLGKGFLDLGVSLTTLVAAGEKSRIKIAWAASKAIIKRTDFLTNDLIKACLTFNENILSTFFKNLTKFLKPITALEKIGKAYNTGKHIGEWVLTYDPEVEYCFSIKDNKVIRYNCIGDDDMDGINNRNDDCPTTVGVSEFEGCPPPDEDEDGVPDNMDDCRTVAGLDGPLRGCPDDDGDGVPDGFKDDCPTEPGPASNKGCPLPDSDQDGVPDSVDECDDEKGPAYLFGCPPKEGEAAPEYDENGNPDGCENPENPDDDGDGILDEEDDCPCHYGLAKLGGCPDFSNGNSSEMSATVIGHYCDGNSMVHIIAFHHPTCGFCRLQNIVLLLGVGISSPSSARLKSKTQGFYDGISNAIYEVDTNTFSCNSTRKSTVRYSASATGAGTNQGRIESEFCIGGN